MAMDVGARTRGIRPSMNVTPLVDVVLVLLIIFMVVTPLLTKQMWMNVPPKPDDNQPPPPADTLPPIVVSVDATGSARINSEVVSPDALLPTLERMLNARADKVIFFDAPDSVNYGKALQTLDRVKGAGLGTVAVLAEPLQAP